MKILYNKGENLRKELLEGSKLLSEYVSATFGPKGHSVLIKNDENRPIITKDGVTVAQYVNSSDNFKQMAIEIIRQASEKTNLEAGDGTSTSVVLANSILKEANKYIINDYHPYGLKKGIDKCVDKCVDLIKKMSKQIDSKEMIENVALISSNHDKVISKLVAEAVDSVGRDGAISIEESNSQETKLEIVEGFVFDSGIINQAFVTDEKRGVLKYDSPLIFVTNHKIDSLDEIMPLLEMIARSQQPTVFVAEHFDGQALAALVYNSVKKNMQIACIKGPRYGDERKNIMQDLAITTGATYIDKSLGMSLKDVTLEHFGKCKSIESNYKKTIIVGANGDENLVDQRIQQLKQQIKQSDSTQECKSLQERVTRLASCIAILKVGASTEIEMTEKKHRMEDALEAVLSAQDEGVVPGGGVTLYEISKSLSVDDIEDECEKYGHLIVKKCLEEPLKVLCKNANESFEVVVNEINKSSNYVGLNFNTKQYVDMMESGIMDPAKVTICALKNAASAVGTLLTTSHSISINSEK